MGIELKIPVRQVGGSGAVNSVNGQIGDVVLTAEDVGALSDSTFVPSKTSELVNDSGFINDVSDKQDKLTSGVTIKTINGETILGSGNIEVHGGEGGAVDSVNGKQGVVVLTAEDVGAAEKAHKHSYNDLENKPTIPEALAQLEQDINNRTVSDVDKNTWDNKQDKLTSGVNIKTINNQSILGSGNITIQGGEGGDTSELYTIVRVIKNLLKKGVFINNVLSDIATLDELLPEGVSQRGSVVTVRNQVTVSELNNKLILD